MMTLQELLDILPEAEATFPKNASSIVVQDVTADSRRVRPGSLFVAVSGVHNDGHRFISAAIAQGAAAVIGERPLSEIDVEVNGAGRTVPYLRVRNSRRALAFVCAALQGFPSRRLAVVGVTGTDGKTTTSTILESILRAATATTNAPTGAVGVITTVGARICGEEIDTGLHVTTPDAPEVQRFLRAMVDAGCCYAVVESTSHGLHQQRVAAVDFDVAAVTNITHEHLDYHGSREAYVAAKALLFRALFASSPKPGVPRAAVLNADDAGSYDALRAALAEEMESSRLDVAIRSYGIAGRSQNSLDVAVENIAYDADATRFDLRWWGGRFSIESPLIGEFNVYNAACAATAALALGIAPSAVQRGVKEMSPVPGRMERIDAGQPFLAIVDFAHTPVSLERALTTLRPLVGRNGEGGRLIAIFGSAGLRDREKRYLMGRVSGRLADYTIITAEDPRTEDLGEICREIERGVREFAGPDRYVIIPDRSEAIQAGVDMAQPGDVVAAFGKGHERSMCFGEIEYPWSDREAMRTALQRRVR
ncbi:MAG: UDP-N-acetylmuramoyl-L-alanyl-D-glutamate--2,6-diaminopimelate ligase [Caldilinea sp.]|nr:UDP-N-acetylmuramoyl-L-alanyl-D-glutamate--2,6-diaminopimelate ligase [Caldilinea sp.]MDW8439524.1 UDP-N-acetylmuramoyl-L-alanyl-D-glutamate--2,6-diaminopimelate ligase [Caldilineaceae bacterium]